MNITRRKMLGNTLTATTVGSLFGALTGRADERPAEAAKPVEIKRKIKAGWIGVGGRGTALLTTALADIPGLEVVAICDIDAAAAERAAGLVTGHQQVAPRLFTDGEMAWEKMLKSGGMDAVIIATPWKWHTPVAVEAMKQGIVPGVEVPCAMSVGECWQLVDTAERTGVGCMMLENWSFRSDNLALLKMIRAGLFGKIVHVHCAHSHNCIDHWFFDSKTGADKWPAEYLVKYNRDQYPTHSVGPVLSWCDINCGDRFATIASTATASRGINDYFERTFGPDHPGAKRRYAQGDIVTSVLTTVGGKTVVINYDMQLPRPYDNRWMLQGTRGVYSEERNALYLTGQSPKYDEWEPFPPYENRYRHPWYAAGGSGGHGGADGVQLRLFFEAVRDHQPLPLSVYDSVTMSAIVALSGQSIAHSGQPVNFPDFTRGKWEANKPTFANVPS